MKFHFGHHHHHSTGGVIVPTMDHPSSLLVIDAHGSGGSSSAVSSSDLRVEHREHAGGIHEHEGREELDATRHHGEFTMSYRLSASAVSLEGIDMEEQQRQEAKNNSPVSMFPPSPPQVTNELVVNSNNSPCSSGSSSGSSGSPNSKRALHVEGEELEEEECECSRPRSRKFFRLRRNRSRGKNLSKLQQQQQQQLHGGSRRPSLPEGTIPPPSDIGDGGVSSHCRTTFSSDSSDGDEDCCELGGQQQGPVIHHRRHRSKLLKKPLLRRTQSLPVQSKTTVLKGDKGDSPVSLGEGCGTTLAAVISASSLSCTEPIRTHRRHVTFTSVSTRQYSTILGDHPCCPSGPPLSLGWNLEREQSMEFETYETKRQPVRVKSKDNLKLDDNERRGILRSLVVVTSPSASGDEGGSGSNSDTDHHDSDTVCCVYTEKELLRAERRLSRERAANNRAHARMNRRFFKPLTEEEFDFGKMTGLDEAGEGSKEEGKPPCFSSPTKELEWEASPSEENRMDISPVKQPMDV